MYSSTLSLTSALDEVGRQRFFPFGPQGGLKVCGKSCPPPQSGFDPRTIQPAASLYTDWALLANSNVMYGSIQISALSGKGVGRRFAISNVSAGNTLPASYGICRHEIHYDSNTERYMDKSKPVKNYKDVKPTHARTLLREMKVTITCIVSCIVMFSISRRTVTAPLQAPIEAQDI